MNQTEEKQPTQSSDCMSPAKPEPEHDWLHRMIGEWTMEGEVQMGPDQPPMKSTGTERVRSLGGIWIVAEGESEMPDGDKGRMILTLGYDTGKKRYVGTWIGSMMTQLWVYDASRNGDVLSLEAEGPDMSGAPGKTARYKDVIEFKSDDHRVMTSHTYGEDGVWHQFMTATYRRIKR